MFDIILYQPEIPPNTGNIMRLSVNVGARLHLTRPLGFSLDDRLLRRAGLDYREWADVRLHDSLDVCLEQIGPSRIFAATTRGTVAHTEPTYREGDAFLFGPETRGLPSEILEGIAGDQRLYIPMRPDNRSLNLSNSVAVILFEAWRQLGFEGAGRRPERVTP
ncbi:tRNA/rRNA methyltransferase (SpoU) [Thiorhodococcus drewsii AZ1]|uniref:tRNA (cytidine(34)-2'-O)-methyltransferase n=1 Tax=Thiorhodococcus drewsii AZ1 TaxID=765913 RepID=G2E1K3_9GAMM|nr:tRNA (cytidine(34)-2'-O)-methyltransferase [Thiorhodococcus drewsii]EGV31300.1 tRNA/rRNA methyltransferase (SpoU) [Thiorhodococcus drewsii AZ1]